MTQLEPLTPKVAALLDGMEADLLAYTGFPKAHWSKIWSNDPIERLNRELKRRTDVVGIFPDTASVFRLVGALLVEINDEMIAAERRYIAAASVAENRRHQHRSTIPASRNPRLTTNKRIARTSYTTTWDAISASGRPSHNARPAERRRVPPTAG